MVASASSIDTLIHWSPDDAIEISTVISSGFTAGAVARGTVDRGVAMVAMEDAVGLWVSGSTLDGP